MTITPIAFTNAGADVATDADLRDFHPDMSNNIWTGRESYRDMLQASYNHVIFDLSRGTFEDADLIDSSADNIAWFKRATCYQALVRIFRDFRAESGDRWELLMNDYQRLYDEMLSNPVLDYDTDESGAIDDSEKRTSSTLELVR
jgi:hypothetical protein